MTAEKKHNNVNGAAAKVALRRKLMAEVGEAHVLDVYCGPRGKMWREVWAGAASYVGIDKAWQAEDRRRRFVGDSLVVLRHLDLSPFTVFDVDAFGAPWEALSILARRVSLRPSQRIALAVTDGSWQHYRSGGLSTGLAALVGGKAIASSAPSTMTKVHGEDSFARTRTKAFAEIARRLGGRAVKHWHVEAVGNIGHATMHYDALVIEGADAT